MTARPPVPGHAVQGVVPVALACLYGCMPSADLTPNLAPGRDCPVIETGGEGPAISWYFPTTAGDNRRLERWCVTVGPPARLATPTADFGALGAGDSLVIAVWNTDVGAATVIEFLEEQLGLACSGASSALAPGASHFALLIQEAFRRSEEIPASPPQWAIPPRVEEKSRPGPRLDTIEVAARCGLSVAYVAAARNGSETRDGLREDKGVAILSTLLLSDLVAIELPYEAARRVALAATVHHASGDSLRLVSAHLISTAPPARVLTTGNGSRLRQALAIADALRRVELARTPPGATAVPPTSTVLAGDLNTWSDRESTLRQLRERFPDSPPPLGEPTHGPFPTDHILFRRAGVAGSPRLVEGSYVRIDESYYSDHYAIMARVVFEN